MAHPHIDAERAFTFEIGALLGADAGHRLQERDGCAAMQVAVRLEHVGGDGHERLHVALASGDGLDMQRVGEGHGAPF